MSDVISSRPKPARGLLARFDPWRDGITLVCALLLVYLVVVPLVLLLVGSVSTGEEAGGAAYSLGRYGEIFAEARMEKVDGRAASQEA